MSASSDEESESSSSHEDLQEDIASEVVDGPAPAENEEPPKSKRGSQRGPRKTRGVISKWPDFLSPIEPSANQSLSTRLMAVLRAHVRDLLYANDAVAAGDFAEVLMGRAKAEPELLWKLGVQILRGGAETHEDGLRRAVKWLLHLMALKVPASIKMDVLLELAILHADQGLYTDALQQLELYLPAEPYIKNALLHGYAGLLCYKLWRSELAQAGDQWSQQVQFSQAILDPADEPQSAREWRQKALDALRTSVSLEVRNELFVSHLVQLLELEGQLIEAMAILSRLVDRDPVNVVSLRYYLSFIERHRAEIGQDTPSHRECRLALFRLSPAEDVRLTLAPLFAHWDPILYQPRILRTFAEDHPLLEKVQRLNATIEARAIFVEKVLKIEVLLDHLDFAGGVGRSALVQSELNDPMLEPFSSGAKWVWANLADCIEVIRNYAPSVHSMIWDGRGKWWPSFHFGPNQDDADSELVTLKACVAYICFPENYARMAIRKSLGELGVDAETCERYGIEPEELLDPTATAEAVRVAAKPKPVRPRYINLSDDEMEEAEKAPQRVSFGTDKHPNLKSDELTWIFSTLEDIRQSLADPDVWVFPEDEEQAVLSEKAAMALQSPHIRSLLDRTSVKQNITRDDLKEILGIGPRTLQLDWVRLMRPDQWEMVTDLKDADETYDAVKDVDKEAEKVRRVRDAAMKLRKDAKENRSRLAKAVLKKVVEPFGAEMKPFEKFIGPNFRFKHFFEVNSKARKGKET